MQKLFLTKRQKNGNLTLFEADLKVSLILACYDDLISGRLTRNKQTMGFIR